MGEGAESEEKVIHLDIKSFEKFDDGVLIECRPRK
jgi:hypothetical protein